jgi:signal transduction histidine kinase
MAIVASRWRWVTRPFVVDVAIAAVLSVMGQVQVIQQHASAPMCLAIAAVTVPLAWRRRFPLLVCAAVGLAAASMIATDKPPSVFGEYLAIMLAGFTVAERCRTRDAVAGALFLAAGVVAHDWHSTEYGSPSGLAADLFIPALVWGLGRVVHAQRSRELRATERAATLDRERLELARVAVEAERRHLARELHDVVTHSLSVVVIQAQAAAGLVDPAQPAVRAAVDSIESASRSALADMRRLLGLMRDDDADAPTAPQPTLADLPALFERIRGAGVTVTERVDAVDAADGVGLSVFRIVQEALTNAVKHAPGCAVSVSVERRDDVVVVEVANTAPRATTVRAEEGGGRGLLGIAERVALFGGSVVSGPTSDGGFAVHAVIPAGGSR